MTIRQVVSILRESRTRCRSRQAAGDRRGEGEPKLERRLAPSHPHGIMRVRRECASSRILGEKCTQIGCGVAHEYWWACEDRIALLGGGWALVPVDCRSTTGVLSLMALTKMEVNSLLTSGRLVGQL